MSEDVNVGENGAKTQVIQKYSHACLKIKLWRQCLRARGSHLGRSTEFKHTRQNLGP
jgi:hypothetical protein